MSVYQEIVSEKYFCESQHYCAPESDIMQSLKVFSVGEFREIYSKDFFAAVGVTTFSKAIQSFKIQSNFFLNAFEFDCEI